MTGYARFIDDTEIEYSELNKEEYGERYGYFHDYIRDMAVCDCTFFNCKTIRDVSLPETFNHVGCHAFHGCERLTRCFIPETVKCIDEHAFSTCFNLQFLELPEGISEVSYCVCEHCPNLSIVKLPSTIRRIRVGAFSHCSNLTVIVFNGTVAQWNNIPKDRDWDLHCGEYAVRCNDGAIQMKFAN